jgi:hypothetical protein
MFIDGRATAPAGDSLLAFSAQGLTGVLVYDRRNGNLDTLGAGELVSATHVQWVHDRWYVSDVRDGRPWIIIFSPTGTVLERIAVDRLSEPAHQFAVLPDGAIVLESPDDRLIALGDDSSGTFALVEASPRAGMLIAARGGVLHVVPDRAMTLYNALGKVRWRTEWPWKPGTFVTDLSVDSQGRPHLLAGREDSPAFVVFGLDPLTGEVLRWMEGPVATFAIRRHGDIEPQHAEQWVAGIGGGSS